MNPKGPIIGPLIIAGALIDEKDLNKLEEIGVTDSKLLTYEEISGLAKKLQRLVTFRILEISPKEIDDAIDIHDHMNLNWLEARKSAEIINELNPERVVLDCPSPNILKYKEYVGKLIKDKNIEIIAEHKSELKFIIVAAASILAKNYREKSMDKIKRKYGKTGSGYLSDQDTQEFLENNWDKHPEILRRSWSSWKNYKKIADHKKLTEF